MYAFSVKAMRIFIRFRVNNGRKHTRKCTFSSEIVVLKCRPQSWTLMVKLLISDHKKLENLDGHLR